MRKTLILFVSTILLMSCQTTQQTMKPTPTGTSRAALTPAAISKIEKGVSTKNDIINLFGSPNIITQNSDGKEVWHYSRMQVERYDENSGSGTGLVPALVLSSKQSKSFATTSSKSFDLAVTFNHSGTTESYKSVSSQF